MNHTPIFVFVCEHGAAKSVVAAAHFNRLARESGLDLRAIARGTNPDDEISPQAIQGLSRDGLAPTESTPQKIGEADLQSTRQIVAFCELPVEYYSQAIIEHWDDIPPVSENYEKARDAIIERIHILLNQ